MRGRAMTFPSVNPRGYEVGCWLRWLGAAAVANATRQPVLMVDTDVINVGLTPAHVRKYVKKDITFFDKDRVCCAVCLTPAGAARVVESMLDYQPAPDCTHTSDMFFFWEKFSKCLPTPEGVQVGPPLCWDYDYIKKGHKERPAPLLIHFSAKSCDLKSRTPKTDAIVAYQKG